MKQAAENPKGEKIYFDEASHKYMLENNRVLTSVTTFISSFFPKFEKEKVSKKHAKKLGITQQELLNQWEKKGADAMRVGTYIHLYCECKLSGQPFRPRPLQANKEISLMKTADKSMSDLLEQFEFIEAEKIVFSESMGLAGTIDLLMHDKKNNHIMILDWKTNEKIEYSNHWRQALEPISHLDDCNGSHYVLQLSTYKHILQSEGYFPDASGYGLALIHLSPTEYKIIRGSDLNDEVQEMLLWV